MSGSSEDIDIATRLRTELAPLDGRESNRETRAKRFVIPIEIFEFKSTR
jgi:hypothetical protein